jgi:hypothetical protein
MRKGCVAIVVWMKIRDAKIIALASATEGKLHGKGPEILTA